MKQVTYCGFGHFTTSKVTRSLAEDCCLLNSLREGPHYLDNIEIFAFCSRKILLALIKSREVRAKVTATHFLHIGCHLQKIQLFCSHSQPFFWQRSIRFRGHFPWPVLLPAFFGTRFALTKFCCLSRRSLEAKYIFTYVQISWSLKQRDRIKTSKAFTSVKIAWSQGVF